MVHPMIPIFDGHNDAVQHMQEYLPGGRDFLRRSAEGHLDLPRAQQGGMFGGLFALMAHPAEPPHNDLTLTPDGYAVRLADALDPDLARGQILAQLAALQQVEARSAGTVRLVRSADELEACRQGGIFAVVLHLEGADALDPDLALLGELYAAGLRSLGLVWSRPNRFGHGVPFAFPRSPDTGPGLTDAGLA